MPKRSGFTLIESAVVSGLLALLALLLTEAWIGLGRPLAQAIGSCRVAQEANLALTSLARDLGGSQPGIVGSPERGRLVGRLAVDGSELWICYDGGGAPNGVADWAPPDTVIVYLVRANQLLRQNQLTGEVFVAAANVEAMELADLGNGIDIRLTFRYRDTARTFTIVAKDP